MNKFEKILFIIYIIIYFFSNLLSKYKYLIVYKNTHQKICYKLMRNNPQQILLFIDLLRDFFHKFINLNLKLNVSKDKLLSKLFFN